MKKGMILAFLILSSLIPAVYSESIEVPIQQLTYHAEQYETGNINYAQLLIYSNNLKNDIANAMGANSMDKDYILSQDQLESAFGKPTDFTRWVWVEDRDQGGGYEKKLDNQVPNWRKLLFDGQNLQIMLNAWPQMRMLNGQEKLFYRLNMEIRFKSQEDKVDLQSNINEIKLLGDKYANDHSTSSLDELAKKSVAFEELFKNYYNMNAEKCVNLMTDIFGSENKRASQKILHEEVDFASGKTTDVIINIDMCDDCQNNWINLNANMQTRVYKGNNNQGQNMDELTQKYISYSDEEFKIETKKILDEIKQYGTNDQVEQIYKKSDELSALSKAWDQSSNNKFQRQNNDFKDFFDKMTPEERDQCSKEFCWIKKEQERKENERTLRNQNYNEKKQFYLSLFADFKKTESYYEEEQWEKRILEKFREAGEEKCDNNVDDNKNGQVDCADDQCSGKKCGYAIKKIINSNETNEINVELFCIAGTCQQKGDNLTIENANTSICGNHICEPNENSTCPGDCGNCPTYNAINCSGQAIFSGKDENGCLLAPICIDDSTNCSIDSDCVNPLCGKSSCVEGICKITEISECKEAECVDGDEKSEKCSEGEEIITTKCIDGAWIKTGLECKSTASETNVTSEPIKEEINNSNEVAGSECSVKEDCGNPDDVCSNGKCITLPKTTESNENTQVKIVIPEATNNDKENEVLKKEQTAPVNGKAILNVFKSFAYNILAITGYSIEGGDSNGATDNSIPEETTGGDDNSQSNQNNVPSEENNQNNNPSPDNNQNQNNNDDERRRQEENRVQQQQDQARREAEDKDRRTKECSDGCTRQCNDNLIRLCVEDCIWKKCGNDLKCNIDEIRKQCQTQCEGEKDASSCQKDCNAKCIEGKDTRMLPDNKNQKQPESFVLSMIGTCRKATGKEETMLWFNVWGEDIKDMQAYKNKYYNRDNNEWCKQDLESLIKQRRELEKSLNNEFAAWFFEKYIVNTDIQWEKQMAGINDLYWMDMDISKQMADRMRCLGIDTLPEFKLIT